MDGFLTVYTAMADQVIQGHSTVDELAVESLPLLNEPGLALLGNYADQQGWQRPLRAYAFMQVVTKAAVAADDPLLQAQALWYLGRAANAWARPHLVTEAIEPARRLFVTLAMPDWIAACDWQVNAQPWTRPDFVQAAAQLESALEGLQTAVFTTFIPYCRQSLAMAYLLIGRHDEAVVQLTQAEAEFIAQNDLMGQGLCHYTWGRYQRVQADYTAAEASLQAALSLFHATNAPVFVAMTQYSQAFVVRLMTGDLAAAMALYEEALVTFAAADLPLWSAQCYEGLSTIYNFAGQLDKAESMALAARASYALYDLPGLQATNLLNLAQLTQFRGDYASSLAYLTDAHSLFVRAGNRWLPAVTLFNQGEVLAEQGRYHQALQKLELAWQQLKQLGNMYRLVACTWRLAVVWQQLGNVTRARAYLTDAMAWFDESEKLEWLPQIYLLQAEIADDVAERLSYARQAWDLAQRQGVGLLVAKTQRAYGEALLLAGEDEAAVMVLETAVTQLATTQMRVEEAATYLILGRAYAARQQLEAAQEAWRQALTRSETIAPEIAWQAEAEIAAQTAVIDPAQGFVVYQHALAALIQLRRNLWQPALVGDYLKRSIGHMDTAVALAAQVGTPEDVIRFSEESKAQTVLHRLHKTEEITADLPPSLQTLVAEIRWLQQQLRANNIPPNRTYATMQSDLRAKVQMYQQQIGTLERQQTGRSGDTSYMVWQTAVLRQQAQAHIGDDWLAFSYYLTETTLFCAVITPEAIELYQQPLTRGIRFALRECIEQQCRSPRITRSLTQLGEWLFPPAIQSRLTPETTVVIAPHRKLHHLPWAALRVAEGEKLLVETAVPVIVPSLQSLLHLWQRSRSASTDREAGLVVAVSQFAGRHGELGAVERETAVIRQLFNNHCHILENENATLANLKTQHQTEDWLNYTFLHIASHAFADKFTGHLSGIALHDQDIWLDEIPQLAPLPALVTLSACSGLQSRLHPGDEPMGLVITCLAAGGEQVVGSLWPIADLAAPRLMEDFYQHWRDGSHAPQALALMQRAAYQRGEALTNWAGFQCVGCPVYL